MAFGCVKNTILLGRSGRYFDLADPKPDQFTIEDIALALSNICRFGGHTPKFYSVAEHSINCSKAANREGHCDYVQAACLMHDATEAFIGDMVKPLKIMMPGYQELEARIMIVIGEKWGIDFVAAHEVVDEIDRSMLIAERRAIMPRDNVKWTGEDEVKVRGINPMFWLPPQAEEIFLSYARRLRLT